MGEDTKTDANFNYTEDQKVDFIDFEIWRQGYLEDTSVTPTDMPIVTNTPTPAINPEATTTPSATPTPGTITACQWCGSSCVPADANMMCPQVAPPEGATCTLDAGQCVEALP